MKATPALFLCLFACVVYYNNLNAAQASLNKRKAGCDEETKQSAAQFRSAQFGSIFEAHTAALELIIEDARQANAVAEYNALKAKLDQEFREKNEAGELDTPEQRAAFFEYSQQSLQGAQHMSAFKHPQQSLQEARHMSTYEKMLRKNEWRRAHRQQELGLTDPLNGPKILIAHKIDINSTSSEQPHTKILLNTKVKENGIIENCPGNALTIAE